jgi:hypothetical protein
VQEDNAAIRRHVRQVTGIQIEVTLDYRDNYPVEADNITNIKMIEQISQIENFRREVEQRDGRKLNSEQAAREWVSKYAGDFPALN